MDLRSQDRDGAYAMNEMWPNHVTKVTENEDHFCVYCDLCHMWAVTGMYTRYEAEIVADYHHAMGDWPACTMPAKQELLALSQAAIPAPAVNTDGSTADIMFASTVA